MTPLPLNDPAAGAPTTPPRGSSDSQGGESSRNYTLAGAYAALGPLAARSGIAIVPTAGAATRLQTAGAVQSGVAWSSIKVPLSMAALAVDGSERTRSEAAGAIQRSDNAAAAALWTRLGSGSTAASRTTSMLRRGGDQQTVVQSRQTRPPYSPFGQTVWSLPNAARFGSNLPCLTEAADVLPLMSAIISDQRWGLGRIPGAAFKGGWGPSRVGYLVRQVGVVPTSDGGYLGVAIMVQAPGGFGQGTQDLDRIARWLHPRLASLPGGRCPGGR